MAPNATGTSRRIVEAALATALLVVALPLIAVGVLLSFACYRAWPFFVHERVGLDGESFRLWKIRTLPPTTDRYADKYALQSATVPRLMQAVRRLHFDELPQLIHVCAGTMTFVGPRPEMPTLHAALPESFARLRTSVRPGLTCLWQISPHNTGLIGERTEYDRLYVDHRNTRLDLWIMVQTLRKMTLGRTIHLFEVPRWAINPVPLGVGIAPLEQPIAASVTGRPLSLVD